LTNNTPAEQRLAARIRALINRLADDNSYTFAMINKEMAQPTRLLADILENEINPARLKMLSVVKECLGVAASDEQVLYCYTSIMGQCFQLLQLKHIRNASHFRSNPTDLIDSKAFAEHVVQFSLAGIHAIRSQTLD
jgi:hypothetical protein